MLKRLFSRHSFELRFFKFFYGLNSQKYWEGRFKSNWELLAGRLQTVFHTTAFALLKEDFGQIESVLDYGAATGDSMPILNMRFPDAKLYYYDFSETAMRRATELYSKIAFPFDVTSGEKTTLVYCSHVVEHIVDIESFLSTLFSFAAKHVVIQAPYDQHHLDGSILTPSRPYAGEHVRTVNEEFLRLLPSSFSWRISFYDMTPGGKQIFIIGTLK